MTLSRWFVLAALVYSSSASAAEITRATGRTEHATMGRAIMGVRERARALDRRLRTAERVTTPIVLHEWKGGESRLVAARGRLTVEARVPWGDRDFLPVVDLAGDSEEVTRYLSIRIPRVSRGERAAARVGAFAAQHGATPEVIAERVAAWDRAAEAEAR